MVFGKWSVERSKEGKNEKSLSNGKMKTNNKKKLLSQNFEIAPITFEIGQLTSPFPWIKTIIQYGKESTKSWSICVGLSTLECFMAVLNFVSSTGSVWKDFNDCNVFHTNSVVINTFERSGQWIAEKNKPIHPGTNFISPSYVLRDYARLLNIWYISHNLKSVSEKGKRKWIKTDDKSRNFIKEKKNKTKTIWNNRCWKREKQKRE